MKKTGLYFGVVALAAVLTLSACGNNNNGNNTASPSASAPAASSPAASSPAASAPAAGGGAVQEVTINASNWKFDVTEIKAKVGDTIKLTLKNADGVHGIAIEDLGVKIKNEETVEIKLDKAGTFEYHCSIQCGQGHDNMTGLIVVE